MLTIPSELHRRLCETLSRCAPFDNDRTLRDIFVDERLAPWRNRVPENTTDHASRVYALVNTLYDQYNDLGENALVLFLQILAEQVSSGNALQREITQLVKALSDVLSNPFGGLYTNNHPLYQFPPLPPLVIGRENALRDLKIRLGILPGERTFASMQILTAIKGWPGVGKTTLAAVIAHDSDTAKTFPDGVLWTSLGPTPNLLGKLVAWGYALGIDGILRARTVEEVSSRLAHNLGRKRMLLIVDDVWQLEHASPFKVGGRHCAMLITTRVNRVAQELAPTPDSIYCLSILTDEKAMELLRILAPTVVAQHPESSLELVRELEGLPLALQVAGRLLNIEASYGFEVTHLLVELREGARLLQEKAPADRADLVNATTHTVAALLKKSTDFLDEHTRESFALLGVFAPKPATFSLDAMKAIWLVDDPKPIARILIDRGLLEPVGSGHFQMHVILVMHAKSLCVEV